MPDKYYNLTLPNGIRLVHRPHTLSEIVHCGLVLNTGSRDETPDNNGVAHFIEHAVFKGTEKRSSNYILKRIENVGGELNAYTTREKTCYYASCLKQYAGRAVDIISDIAFNATFPEKEMQKEKKVIIEEIEMYDDSADESIYDEFYAMLFKDHSLGFNILGTSESVNKLDSNILRSFVDQNYISDNIILSLTGNISIAEAERLARKFLEGRPAVHKEDTRKAPLINSAFHETKEKDFAQTHCMIGSPAYSRYDSKRYGLTLIHNILGGLGMSSRLNMAVREKHGYTYHISSNYSNYQDTGVFSIYFACDKKNLNRCRKLVHLELKKMRDNKLSAIQLHQAKQQLLGMVAMMEENQSVHMQAQARSVLDYGRVYTFKDYLQKVDEVTASEILEISNEILDPSAMSELVYMDV